METIYHPSVQEFIDNLEAHARSKVFRAIDQLERLGHRLVMPHTKHIDRNLWELRIPGR